MSRDTYAPTPSHLARGTCPVCGREVALRAGGLLRYHGEGNPMNPGFKHCPGTAQPATTKGTP